MQYSGPLYLVLLAPIFHCSPGFTAITTKHLLPESSFSSSSTDTHTITTATASSSTFTTISVTTPAHWLN